MTTINIKFKNVSKRFRIYHSGKQRFFSLFSSKYRNKLERAVALDNVSFEITKGEVVNIIGISESGKSTLLDLISKVITPNKGEVIVKGKVYAKLDSTMGFNNNYNGYKNLKVKGALLGLPKSTLKDTIEKAAEFSELGSLLNKPIITLSKSQRARLAPSFALSLQPDILLIDKTLKAGDDDFKKKCTQRLTQILENPEVTALFVSKKPSKPSSYCSRGIILKKGKLVFDGSLEEAEKFFV